jgi:predicted metal-binding membrane protein
MVSKDNIVAENVGHPYMPPAQRGFESLVGRPHLALFAAVLVCAGTGWGYLLVMTHAMGSHIDLGVLGPGMSFISTLLGARPGLSGADHLAVHALLAMPAFGPWGLADLTLVFVMWLMMVLAMMIPTAAPMMKTYADLADTAARQREPATSVLFLGAGYLSVWIAFAAAAAALQWLLTEFRYMSPLMEPVQSVVAGTMICAAGVYQFSPAKNACLIKCRSPFAYFFANWTARPGGVYRLGLAQGLFCLGCCWAMMLMMFAVGVMNVIWIALLAFVMALEKTVDNPFVPRAIGVALIAVGALVLLDSETGRALCGI